MKKQAEIYDLIIRHGLVIDGTGAGAYPADIAVKKGRICAVGSLEKAAAPEEIDASGRTVTPGFIDIHSHCDQLIQEVPGAENYLLQGVTTFLGGNYAALVGFGDLRRAAMADPTAAMPEKKELKKLKELMEAAMQAGAFGFSTGLEYIPDRFASAEEIEAVASVAAS